jgi:hypothetical protein
VARLQQRFRHGDVHNAALKSLRAEEEQLKVGDLEASITMAMQEIEAGNARLGQLMGHLTRENVQFESMMTGACTVMSELGGKFAALPAIARPARTIKARSRNTVARRGQRRRQIIRPALSAIYHDTMQTGRDVHLRHCERFGIARPAAAATGREAAAGIRKRAFFLTPRRPAAGRWDQI